MNKEDQIRDLIIQTSLSLFNKKGYNQTSIQDIMTATALPKGAIYRRFENKNDIAIASFTLSMKIIWDHYFEAIKSKITATDKIIAMFEVYQDAVHTPPVDGGCPLLNTAIESDDGFPELHELAANSHKETLLFLQSIIEEGIHAKEFSQHVNAYSLASFLFSTLEGAVMSSRLALNNDHMNHSIEQITYLLQQYAPKNQEV